MTLQLLNAVTIRDPGMPRSVDEFPEDFARYPINSAIDYYSRYSQISLDKRSRDLTAFNWMSASLDQHDYLRDGPIQWRIING
jgi:hypothetical protein